MTNQKGPAPAPLHPRVVKTLLDLLSSDDDFRDLFQRDAHAALVKAGYQAPEGRSLDQVSAAESGGACMQLRGSHQLASKEQIIRERAKLEQGLTLVQHFDPAMGLLA